MHSFAIAAAAVALASQAFAVINTPSSLVECQPIQLSWDATTSPYYLAVFPGGTSTGALESFPSTTDTTYTWTVDLAANTNVTIGLTDGTGVQYYTSAVVIQAGSDSSCLNSTSSASGSSATATAASGTSSGTATAGATTSGTSTSSSTSAAASSSNAAGRGAPVAFGLAGALGLVGAALL